MKPHQQGANAALPAQPAQAPDVAWLRRAGMYNPERLRVRVRWEGMDGRPYAASPPVGTVQRNLILSSGRVLGDFDMPKARLRVIWLGPDSMSRQRLGALAWLAVLLLGLFAFTQLAPRSSTNGPLDTKKVVPAGLVADEFPLGNQTIQMVHSPLDMGQARDVFDNNVDTLMRGRDANPFIIDLQFPQPQSMKGLRMDFGRMDFVIRVQVYGTESTDPVSYEGEYRQQPDVPHIDMDFVNGPDQVQRIYIEIEQLNAPDEVHIHIREVGFNT